MDAAPPSSFKRRPRAVRWLRALAAVGIVAVLLLGAMELGARALGLGAPILYYSTVEGGVRPLARQASERVGGARVTIDENGFRSVSTVPAADSSALRILYLGGSVTWGGSQVDDPDTYAEQASEVVRAATGRPVYAMNAGVNGASLLNAAEVYAVESERADVIVWLFPWGSTVRPYISLGPLLPARLAPRFAAVELVDQLLFRYWLGAFRESSAPGEPFTVDDLPPGYDDVAAHETEARRAANLAALQSVVADARRRGVPILVGVTPTVRGDAPLPVPSEAQAALDEARAAGAVVFDAHAVVAAEGGPDGLFLDGVHFSPAGHHAIGAALGDLILLPLADSTAR